jgi:FkbM family methyltransferase
MEIRGPYKDQVLDILVERGIPVGSVFDVGVLRGTPELLRAYPKTHHYLFEPVTEFEDLIEKAYADCPHTLIKVAVSDSDSESFLATHSVHESLAISHSTVAKNAQEGPNVRKIETMRLDTFMANNEVAQPILLKIDIDGEELAVLRGATETLKSTSILIIETPRYQLPDRILFARNAGFVLVDLAEPTYYDQAFWQCDAVFVRRDLHEQFFKQLNNKSFDPKLYTTFK